MAQKLDTYAEILSLDTIGLANFLVDRFALAIPDKIETADELNVAGNMLGKITNDWVFIESLAIFVRAMSSQAKRNIPDKTALDYKEKKDAFDEVNEKKIAIQSISDIIKQRYNAVSRMVTVKMESNNELRMTGTVYEKKQK